MLSRLGGLKLDVASVFWFAGRLKRKRFQAVFVLCLLRGARQRQSRRCQAPKWLHKHLSIPRALQPCRAGMSANFSVCLWFQGYILCTGVPWEKLRDAAAGFCPRSVPRNAFNSQNDRSGLSVPCVSKRVHHH